MGLNLVKKTYDNTFSEHLTIVLKEMCARVGANYDKLPMKDKEKKWFHLHTWTIKEQDDYIEWLANYLYTNTKARRELMTISYQSKKRCRDFAQFFVFNYGWKTS